MYGKDEKMKLNDDFIVHISDDETLLVPVGGSDFSGIVKGNKTLQIILECLKEDTTEDRIVQFMTERFDAPEDVIRADVTKAIANLRKVGALNE